MKIFSIFFFLCVLTSCNNANTTKKTKSQKSDTIISAPIISIHLSPQADSIEKTNAATIRLDGDDIQKASISKTDSSIDLLANMKLDHRIFGYEKPDTSSKKMILLSIFTDDVKDNPFELPYGAYYSTSDVMDMELKFVRYEGNFIKVEIMKNKVVEGIVFIKKGLVEFE